MNNNYLDYDCKNCGRHRVEINGICEKCNYDNIENEYAKPINDCLEYGAGSCRNADLIDKLRADLANANEIIARLKEDGEVLYDLLLHSNNNFIEQDNRMINHRALMKELE